MEIIKMKLSDLTPYKNNAKLHDAEQIEQIKKSIKEFGNNDPIAVWGENNTIVEGHGRYLALGELGYDEVEVIRLDHLTDEERKAYTLAHNKLTMNSDFDIDILNDELMNFDTIDMEDFGFLKIDDDFDLNDLDDEREKEKVNVSIVFDTYEEYETIKKDLELLIEKTNGNLSIKMI